MSRNVFVYKIQCELSCPKLAWNIWGFRGLEPGQKIERRCGEAMQPWFSISESRSPAFCSRETWCHKALWNTEFCTGLVWICKRICMFRPYICATVWGKVHVYQYWFETSTDLIWIGYSKFPWNRPRSVMETYTILCRAVIKGHNPLHLSRLSMLDGTLVLWVNLPLVGTIYLQLQGNKLVMGVEIKATGDSKLNNSPALYCQEGLYNERQK